MLHFENVEPSLGIMPMALLFANRRLKIAYWDHDAKFANAAKINLERVLGQIADFQVTEVKAIDQLSGFDLLFIAAHTVPTAIFRDWLRGVIKKMNAPKNIWTPAVIVAPVPFEQFKDAVVELTMSNWYFDIVDPAELESIPIRVANLVRIHDHLHELSRYQAELAELDRRVQSLEGQLK